MSEPVEKRSTYCRRSAAGSVLPAAEEAALNWVSAAPILARLASWSRIRPTRNPLERRSDSCVMSRPGMFVAFFTFGHVASPPTSPRSGVDETDTERLGFAVSNPGPCTSFAKWTNGDCLGSAGVEPSPNWLLLSLNTTPIRPCLSTPRSIMSNSERSWAGTVAAHVVPSHPRRSTPASPDPAGAGVRCYPWNPHGRFQGSPLRAAVRDGPGLRQAPQDCGRPTAAPPERRVARD